MTKQELDALRNYLQIKVNSGFIKQIHADDIYDLMKIFYSQPVQFDSSNAVYGTYDYKDCENYEGD